MKDAALFHQAQSAYRRPPRSGRSAHRGPYGQPCLNEPRFNSQWSRIGTLDVHFRCLRIHTRPSASCSTSAHMSKALETISNALLSRPSRRNARFADNPFVNNPHQASRRTSSSPLAFVPNAAARSALALSGLCSMQLRLHISVAYRATRHAHSHVRLPKSEPSISPVATLGACI